MSRSERINVSLRFRPLNQREVSESEQVIWRVTQDSVTIKPEVQQVMFEAKRLNAPLKTYMFSQCFTPKHCNEEVYQQVVRRVVQSSLEGYNGTIFAYGQTGSGKTFTITGAPERYEDRGIIPRTLQYIFAETKKRNTFTWRVCISYLEVYNNEGYDLLNENSNTKELEDLPKVILRENQKQQVVLSNLSVHQANNDEEALNLLFIGDTNREVAVTPKNDVSTRSHCIFIIQIESQKIGEDVKNISKLHIVDLSGSESKIAKITLLQELIRQE